ncbi:hypothetical protein COU18_01135 [Candidatus Kaiserbacteria bacterium CG10_big_fil_rev_8_21_14_0_10_51_14]|uniref:SCP domain-containing protein n=1 Tax=Candidatus Kaiserbacteria bacterium CG10_big_fil_rev_8_21_14_0_10_51_14 TaxID=1974610 RepID=A0A2H0UDY1_9BACT|nr:MAG: hypothetical protein COU18_01135 [Candidatus Kaiserbacteria bacterium CG10_big_fil_rev_8_21_14_0_10_51_14]
MMVRGSGRRPTQSFFPKRKGERRRVELMGGLAVGLFSALVISIFLASSVTRLFISSDQYASVVAAVLVDLANGDRADNSLGTLTMNPILVAAAQAKADDMAGKGYFAHTAPDGTDSWHWFQEAGYTFSYAGENLAVDFSDSVDVERAWMQSPTHRDNILGQQFTEIGIATAQGMYEGRFTTFVVQMFAAPSGALAKEGEAAEVTTIRENSPKDATEPALASTQPIPTVLGTSEPPANTAAESSAPLAAMRGSDDSAPIGAVVNSPKYAPAWGFLAASPKTTMRYAYYVIGFLVLLALVIATELEFKRHHTRKFIMAACLLVFMSGLFVTADTLIFSEPVLAATDLSP